MHRRSLMLVPLFGAIFVASCALVADVEPIEYRATERDAAGAVDATGIDGGNDQDGGHGATSCDQDGDGWPSKACGGTDCDDTDPRVHPGADFSDAVPPKGSNGDWNCDGQVTKKIPDNQSCSSFDKDCDLHSGFATVVACGETAKSTTCVYSGLTKACVELPGAEQKQSCR